MPTCDTCKTQLLDHLYGLLDETEARDFRLHLENCPACQAALKHAESQQKLFARAARIDIKIPEFSVLGFDDVITPAEPVPPKTPALMPLPSPRKKNRIFQYMSWTIAVAVMLAVSWGYISFSQTLSSKQVEVAQARQLLDTTEMKLAAVQVQYEKKHEQLASELKNGYVQLQVAGPVQVHPEVAAPIRVKTVDLQGKPKNARVKVQVVDLDHKKTVYRQDYATAGELAFNLPTGLTGNNLSLQVQDRDNAAVQLSQPLSQATPSYLSHLALNKTTYYIGELLFFRTLTLENYSLKPAPTNIPLRYTLVDLKGKSVKELEGVTGPGGIAGGEFALTPDIASGVYRVEVAARDGTRVLPQSRRVEIFRDITPQVETDKSKYLPGQNVNLSLRYRGQQNQAPLANKDITVQPLTSQGLPGAAPQQLRTDAKGSANYQLPNKLDTNRAVLEIQVHDGKRQEKLVQAIPVVPSQVIVDFFPEGGDLVEGLPARVYYRVMSPKGEPVEQPGRVIILSSTDVIHDSEPSQGTGVFTFTPKLGETYSVRVTSPKSEIQAPFQKLGIKKEGVVLSVPTGVSREGETVKIVVGNKGKTRNLLVLATCRGQIVGQQPLTVAEGQASLALTPVMGAAGVLRITLFESADNALVPLAERLVYRVPARRLNVTATTKGGPVLRPNQHVDMTIQGQNENAKAESFWSLVAVVDEKFRSEKERTLPEHFFLANDLLNPESLEQTHLLLGDAPEYWPALDLFLGTQGWRRFVAAPSQPMLAKLAEARQPTTVHGQQAAFFQHQSASAGVLNKQYHADLSKALAHLRAETLAHREDLLQQKQLQEQQVRLLASGFADFQQLPQFYLRLAGGVAMFACLLVGCLLILVGLVRLMRRLESTWAFGGGLVAVGLCLVLYLGFKPSDLDVAPRQAPAVAENKKLLEPLAMPKVESSWSAPTTEAPVGQFALAAMPKAEMQRDRASANLDDMAPLARKAPVLAMAPAMGGAGGFVEKKASAGEEKEKADLQGEMKQRFLQAKQAQEQLSDMVRESAANGQKTPAPVPPASPAKKDAPQAVADSKAASDPQAKVVGKAGPTVLGQDGLLRQYAFRRAKNNIDFQDTVLWHPALVAQNGQAQVSFDLGTQPTSYRILIFSNTADGRLGFFESTLQSQP